LRKCYTSARLAFTERVFVRTPCPTSCGSFETPRLGSFASCDRKDKDAWSDLREHFPDVSHRLFEMTLHTSGSQIHIIVVMGDARQRVWGLWLYLPNQPSSEVVATDLRNTKCYLRATLVVNSFVQSSGFGRKLQETFHSLLPFLTAELWQIPCCEHCFGRPVCLATRN
jgi:hypothetical protein